MWPSHELHKHADTGYFLSVYWQFQIQIILSAYKNALLSENWTCMSKLLFQVSFVDFFIWFVVWWLILKAQGEDYCMSKTYCNSVLGFGGKLMGFSAMSFWIYPKVNFLKLSGSSCHQLKSLCLPVKSEMIEDDWGQNCNQVLTLQCHQLETICPSLLMPCHDLFTWIFC